MLVLPVLVSPLVQVFVPPPLQQVLVLVVVLVVVVEVVLEVLPSFLQHWLSFLLDLSFFLSFSSPPHTTVALLDDTIADTGAANTKAVRAATNINFFMGFIF
jgi:hypothetical protein